MGTPKDEQPLFIRCPAHHDTHRPNCAVYADGLYCFACGFRESATDFLRRHRCSDAEAARLPPRRLAAPRRGHQAPAPDSYSALVELCFLTLTQGPRQERLDYLYRRGFAHATLQRYKLGHNGDWFIIPIWHGARLLGVKYRADPRYVDLDSQPKYRNAPGFKNAVFRPQPGAGPTIICEGEFDALLLAQYGYDAVTATGGASALAAQLRREPLPRAPLVATDLDPAGDQAWRQLKVQHPQARRIRWPAGNDISEALLAQPVLTRGKELKQWIAQSSDATSDAT